MISSETGVRKYALTENVVFCDALVNDAYISTVTKYSHFDCKISSLILADSSVL